MRTWFAAALILMMAGTGFAQKTDKGKAPSKAGTPVFATEDQKVIYALGVAMGNSIATFDLSPAEASFVLTGLQDSMTGRKPQVEMPIYGPKIAELESSRAKARLDAKNKKNAAFLDAAAKEKGAVRLPSGVIYTEIEAGTGPTPTNKDKVKAHYRGSLMDGTVFGSSLESGQPYQADLSGGSVQCWLQAIPKIKVGGKAKLVCPPETAYGDEGRPPRIPGSSVLVFEIELLEILPPEPK
ncbi:MAG: FKBP-type peptidyl-prolyl cis-trans isomerase [Elusimicrobia bacterium]|nr:FKBP-type peptidyl-prolyl cis-trans isomerase [Elusimicrobiota bacterium]